MDRLKILFLFFIPVLVISLIALFYVVNGNTKPIIIVGQVIADDITNQPLTNTDQNILEQTAAGDQLEQWWAVTGEPMVQIKLRENKKKECISHINKYKNRLKKNPTSEYYITRLNTWRERCTDTME